METINITEKVGEALEKAGFGSDSNTSLNIEEAGIWDLMDAMSGMNNIKFGKEEAMSELKRRGL